MPFTLQRKVFRAIMLALLVLALWSCEEKQTVLICTGPHSHAYHRHQCEGLKQCSAEVNTVTVEEAIQQNRTPCHFCYNTIEPAEKINEKESFGQSAGSNNNSRSFSKEQSRCTAFTKKGKQCSRKARSNGKCWQHGG